MRPPVGGLLDSGNCSMFLPRKRSIFSFLASSDPPADKLSALVTDRLMKAWYHLSIAWAWPSTGGSHGKPHRTTKILSHARRRGGYVAACGACAAGGQDPARRVHPSGNPEQRSSSRGIRTRDARPRLCRRAHYYLRVSLLWR